jgi:hypothetical protein
VAAGVPSNIDAEISAFGPSQLPQLLHERGHIGLGHRLGGGGVHEHADAPHSIWLLRACRERPGRRRATKQRDEVATTDVDCHVTLPWEVMPMQWRDDITLLSVRSVITSSLGAPLNLGR